MNICHVHLNKLSSVIDAQSKLKGHYGNIPVNVQLIRKYLSITMPQISNSNVKPIQLVRELITFLKSIFNKIMKLFKLQSYV